MRRRSPPRLLLAAAALAAGTVHASAQQQQPPPPAPLLGDARAAALAREAQRLAVSALSESLREAVRDRLRPFGPSREVAPLASGAPPASYATLVEPGVPAWNAWASPTAARSERRSPLFGAEATQLGLSFGADRRVGGAGVLGALVALERTDMRAAAPRVDVESGLAGGGLYGGVALGETLVLDASAIWQGGTGEVSDALRRGSYDLSRVALSANLVAYLPAGGVLLAPTLGVAFAADRQGAFVDDLGVPSPGLTTRATSLRAGLELSRDYGLASGLTLTPFLAATGTWEVARETSPTPAGPVDEPPRGDLSLALGLRAAPSPSTALSLRLEAAGLARPGYEAYSASGQIAVRF